MRLLIIDHFGRLLPGLVGLGCGVLVNGVSQCVTVPKGPPVAGGIGSILYALGQAEQAALNTFCMRCSGLLFFGGASLVFKLPAIHG